MTDLTTDPYANIVELYDQEHDPYDEDIEFYVGLLEDPTSRILEMGAGSGRLLVELAREGFHVTGLDSSAPMLAQAKRRLLEEGVSRNVTLFEGTMQEAAKAPGGPFDLVIFSLNALMHLPSQEEQRDAIAASFAALRKGGIIVFDCMNPTLEQLHYLTSKQHLEASWENEDGSTTDKWSHRDLDSVEQTLDTVLYYDTTTPDGALRRVRTQFVLRYVTPSELKLLLNLAGFTNVGLFGSFALDELSDNSDRIIALAQVPA